MYICVYIYIYIYIYTHTRAYIYIYEAEGAERARDRAGHQVLRGPAAEQLQKLGINKTCKQFGMIVKLMVGNGCNVLQNKFPIVWNDCEMSNKVHRWNRKPRPQPRKSSKLVFLTGFS